MWEMYDAVLRQVQSDDRIQNVRAGDSWVMVKTEKGALGVAAAQSGRRGLPLREDLFIGMPLNEAVQLVKSWDFEEATLGLAAINSQLNRNSLFPAEGEPDAFLRYRDRIQGKKVAIIGRFQYLEKHLKGICDSVVLERRPHEGECPDPACEYILPEMDFVYITGSTVSNKTLPRLLQLSQKAYTVIAGPSTPMTSALFEFGADALCGFCVTDENECVRAAAGSQGIFSCGRMVCWEKE
jgi:hypothetical protein